jgi:hypothetical protein
MKKETAIIVLLVCLAVGLGFDSAIEALTWKLNTNAAAPDAPPPDSDPCKLDPNLPQCGKG